MCGHQGEVMVATWGWEEAQGLVLLNVLQQ
jgi:hypothetical protein